MTGDAYLALARLECAGVTVTLGEGNTLRLKGVAPVAAELIEAARRHKPDILALLRLRLAEPHRLSGEVQI